MNKKYRDEKFLYKRMLLRALEQENKSQLKKWGVQERTLPEWMLFLTEEIGELANAIGEMIYREGPIGAVYNEAIQSAMLALKIAEMVEMQGNEK